MNKSEGQLSLQNSLAGLPQWISEYILQQISQLTHYGPVTGIMGGTGAGRSSLCNALSGGEVSLVSDITACTHEPLRSHLQVGERYMTLADLPGVGESNTRDAEYVMLYRKQLPQLDLILWLTEGDDQVLIVDEHSYRQVIDEVYRHKVLFVISQLDKVEPACGGEKLSIEQKRNISRKVCLLHELFQPANPACAMSICLQWGLWMMTERTIRCLPREASSRVAVQPSVPLRTDAVGKKTRDDFGETVGSILDTVSSMPLVPAQVRSVIQSVRDTVVSVARTIWNFFFWTLALLTRNLLSPAVILRRGFLYLIIHHEESVYNPSGFVLWCNKSYPS